MLRVRNLLNLPIFAAGEVRGSILVREPNWAVDIQRRAIGRNSEDYIGAHRLCQLEFRQCSAGRLSDVGHT